MNICCLLRPSLQNRFDILQFLILKIRLLHIILFLNNKILVIQNLSKGIPINTFQRSVFPKIVVYIDDLNMPVPDTSGAQPPLELIRQLLEMGGLYDTERNTWKVQYTLRLFSSLDIVTKCLQQR